MMKGDQSKHWKGESATYSTKHKWIVEQWGSASHCENPLCKKISNKFDWANISGKYFRVRSDWKQLCRSCHILSEKRAVGEKNNMAKLNNHKVRRIKLALTLGTKRSTLAKIFKVSSSAIDMIVWEKHWKHITIS